jgi:hypothetical protein
VLLTSSDLALAIFPIIYSKGVHLIEVLAGEGFHEDIFVHKLTAALFCTRSKISTSLENNINLFRMKSISLFTVYFYSAEF